ncbi:GRAM domain-containing protein, partial [Gamsiella multidivaricata]|uniref:GRAM domain-containing protein n=1 Tax=Gamsiella multidivaricata TaxID=101098 RepID=UPI00221E7678
METFQPNGGSAYNHDAQEFTYPPQAGGPGSFPESYGANDRQYDYGSEVGTQGNDGGDDAYETNINFVYANEKRLSDFHALFRSVPEDEKLIEDYGCALQKEILVQGRLYISENYVCFNANIFGWVTNLVIAFSEITAIEKRLTAFVIPNAISISTTTNTKGHFFASFLSRDAAHDLLMAAWRKSFPCAANASAASNNVYFQRNRSNVTLNDDDTDTESPGSPPRSHANGAADGDDKKTKGGNRVPTTCKCSKDGRHYANTYMSETFPGSVESIWKLIFDSDFSKGFLTNEVMKGADVQEEAWQKADNGTTTKVTKYTKWLGMPIGPKTTKAILTDVCEHKDFDEYVTTVTTTSTPDVPSGNSFTTKCRTCITWAGPNQVKVLVTGAVEFTKSSWIKGQIEKGAAEGMTTHYKELNASMRKHI